MAVARFQGLCFGILIGAVLHAVAPPAISWGLVSGVMIGCFLGVLGDLD